VRISRAAHTEKGLRRNITAIQRAFPMSENKRTILYIRKADRIINKTDKNLAKKIPELMVRHNARSKK
jgi:hypothetical protein